MFQFAKAGEIAGNQFVDQANKVEFTGTWFNPIRIIGYLHDLYHLPSLIEMVKYVAIHRLDMRKVENEPN